MAKPRSRLSENLAPYLTDESAGVTKLSISLPNDLAGDVRTTAEERGTTVSATIVAALRKAREAEVSSRPEGLLRGLLPGREWLGLVGLATIRGQSVRDLLVEIVNSWLKAQGLLLDPDQARERLAHFLAERDDLAKEHGWTEGQVQAEVDAAVREVRAARRARRP